MGRQDRNPKTEDVDKNKVMKFKSQFDLDG